MGWNVVGNGRTKAKLLAASEQIGSADRFCTVQGDVADLQTAWRLIECAVALLGGIDLLVKNAGVFLSKPFIDVSLEDIELQLATNLKGVVYASQEAARHMIARKGGLNVNITASIAMQPKSKVPAFIAVLIKGGLNAVTRALALELAPHGIRINAIAPGVIDSPMHPPGAREFLSKMQLAGRLRTSREITDAVLYRANAHYTSGSVLPIDGGTSAGNY